jgi:hypothetical protein
MMGRYDPAVDGLSWIEPLSVTSGRPTISDDAFAAELVRHLHPPVTGKLSKVPAGTFQVWVNRWTASRPQATNIEVLAAAKAVFTPLGYRATQLMVRKARGSGTRGRKPGKKIV